MNDFTNMLSQAKKMQDKMKEVQESIKKIEVEGSSGGNSVRVVHCELVQYVAKRCNRY